MTGSTTSPTPPQDTCEPFAYRWSEGSEERIRSEFDSPEFIQKLKDIKVSQEIDTSVGQIMKVTQDVSNKHCTPKRVHKRLPANFPSDHWFDADKCKNSKMEINNLTKETEAQPNDPL